MLVCAVAVALRPSGLVREAVEMGNDMQTRPGVTASEVAARPCSYPGPYVPLAHEAEVFGSCCSVPSWGVVCGVHSPAPGRVCVGTLLPACLVLRPCVVAPPTNCVRSCPGALACA